MANLGYVGLGVMGGRMADRLLTKGHTVTGYNRTKSKAQWLIDQGHEVGRLAPRGVPRRRTSTFVMVTNSAALEAVANGPDGIARRPRPGQDPHRHEHGQPGGRAARWPRRVREKGADMVDAPVSGSVITLEQGKLSVMVGGDARDVRARQAAARRHRARRSRTSATTASRCR